MISTAFIEENFGFHFVCVCVGGVWQGGWEGCLCVWWWWWWGGGVAANLGQIFYTECVGGTT